MDFIDLKTQQARIRERIDRRIAAVLDHGRYLLGPEVDELEEKLADFVGVRHCVSCANGTDALQIALMAVGVGSGDEVIVPAFSFVATAEAVVLTGATPVFVDIDPDTFNIDTQALEAAITERTRAIMPVSLYGQCADFDTINTVAARHGLPVIEDGAQSLGATRHGRRSGALATLGCTSFFPAKPLGGYGDGGAVFTDDDEYARLARSIARHGEKERYHHDRVGMNSRLDTLQAAILLEKLAIFPDELQARERVAQAYHRVLEGAAVTRPVIDPANSCAWAQYTLRASDRDGLIAGLRERDIPTAVHYPRPLHRQPAYERPLSRPRSEAAADEVLSLPMHPYLDDDSIARVGEAVRALRPS